MSDECVTEILPPTDEISDRTFALAKVLEQLKGANLDKNTIIAVTKYINVLTESIKPKAKEKSEKGSATMLSIVK